MSWAYARVVASDRIDDPGGHPVTSGDGSLDLAELDGLLERAGREVDQGLLPACQVAVAHRGRLLATRTYGAAPTSRFLVFSCTKALTAGAIWLLLGDGRLDAAPGWPRWCRPSPPTARRR